MNFDIRPMTLADYDDVYLLWTQTEGMCLGDDDVRDGINLYLNRNSGLCFVALVDANVIGTVLSGHDGRRGILRHLAVKSEFRNRGIGKALTQKCLTALAKQGIKKCNLFVHDDNVDGLRFWENMGFYRLEENYRTLQIATDSG